MKIVIVQRIIPHYRVRFFDLLWEKCNNLGVELLIIYGQECPGSVPKTITYDRPWSKRIGNRYFNIFGFEFVWQPCVLDILKSDGAVIEQANRLSLTYILAFMRLFGYRYALWGHGRNLQAGQNAFGLREFLKRKMLFLANYFLAYTEGCKSYLIDTGFEGDRIANVQNSIDVQMLIDAKINFELEASVQRQDSTVIYCGGIYKDKKIDFLLAACLKMRSMNSNFKIIIIGEGPEDYLVKNFASENSWVEYVGAKSGGDIVPYFLKAKLLLMPGLVGLAILDSFALATPMVTTDLPIHSPEFEYLIHEENGFVSKYDTEEYAVSVIELLKDADRYKRLVDGCNRASQEYSIENMANNFAYGIEKFVGLSSGKDSN